MGPTSVNMMVPPGFFGVLARHRASRLYSLPSLHLTSLQGIKICSTASWRNNSQHFNLRMHMFRCTVNRTFDRANKEYLQLSCRSVCLSCVSRSTVFTQHNDITRSAQFRTSVALRLASLFKIMLYRLPGKSLGDLFKDSFCTSAPW